MSELGILIAVLAVLIINIPAVLKQWREDRPGFIKTAWMLVLYIAYVGVGIWLFLEVLGPAGSARTRVYLAVGFSLAWIAYGGLQLLRYVPRYREPPQFLMKPGALDVALLATIFGCIVGYGWTPGQ
ncbi:hypothetical protein A7A08_01061 [Methyloligella halotolerans]|uniref:Uncharacterized protein n=1 Tax=Methyloligella halotolerans TaxID=1177755 RepID=A0A1E2S096_9HYPH|nr:hypothetical protein [Methyloligella halotolerans]ODA67894.1 hypothetical protein A7A08_01061 [Methyloligella halotolerans]